MRALLHRLPLLCLLPASCLYAQRTLHVPADNPTIQSAIDAASAGDILLVAPGLYPENLNLRGKAISIQSTEGPDVTILDGQHLAPTVSFVTGETRSATLSGFTIRNGAPDPHLPGSHGAGILLHGASPTIIGNTLTDNLCAAVDAAESAPLLRNNRITLTHPDPACLAQAIAPVVLTGDPADPALLPTLLNNTIEHNDFSGSTIQPNAGGITLLAVRAILQSNTIRYNTVPGDTSGAVEVVAQPSSPGTAPSLLQQNLIFGNTTRCGAAGISVTILNDPDTGAATPHLEIEVLSNTVADNVSAPSCAVSSQAAELALPHGVLAGQVLLANNILASSSAHPALQCFLPLQTASLHHNLIHNTAAPAFAGTCLDSGANILTDPQFLDRSGSDYHPILHSPAVDAGADSVSPVTLVDLDAAPRVQDATGKPTAIIDLGAYEYPAPRPQSASTTTVLNATPSNAEAFQAVSLAAQVTSSQRSTPTGSVVLTATAPSQPPIVLATLPLDANGRVTFTTTSLPAASYVLSATYSGAGAEAASASAPITQTVRPATAILAFSATPSDPAQSQAIQLSAHVSAPLSSRLPTGTVDFLDLAPPATPVLLGTAILDPSGNARLILPGLATGMHRIDANYSGAHDFAPVILPASDALTLNVALRDYAQALSTPTLTLASSHHAPVHLTLTSLGSFTDSISISCNHLPQYASCSFAPATATLDPSSTAGIVATVDTDAVPGFAQLPPNTFSPSLCMSLATAFPLALFACSKAARKHRRRLGLLSLLLAALQLSGCGAGKYPGQTPPGTYTVDIVSNAALTGNTHTTQLTLVVTP